MEWSVEEIERLHEEGRQHHAAGQLDAAAAYLRSALEMAACGAQDRAPKLRLDLAIALVDLRRSGQANSVLRPLLDTPPGTLDREFEGKVLLTYGNALYHQGQIDPALSAYLRCLSLLRPVLPPGHETVACVTMNAALCHSRRGRRREALTMLKGLLALGLDAMSDRKARYQVATNLDELGMPEAAQTVLEGLVATASGAEQVDLLLSLAIVHDKQGRSEVALGHYGQAVEAVEALGEARRQYGHLVGTYAAYAAALGDDQLAEQLVDRLRGWLGDDASRYDEIILLEIDVAIAVAKQNHERAAALLRRIEAVQLSVFGRRHAEVYRTRIRLADVARHVAEVAMDATARRQRLEAGRDIVVSASADYDGPAWSIARVPASVVQAMISLQIGRPGDVVSVAPELLAGACDFGVAEMVYQALRLVGLAYAGCGELVLGVAIHKIAAERMRGNQLLMSASYRSSPYNEDAIGLIWRELVVLLAGAQRLPEAEILQGCYKRDKVLDAARRGAELSALSVPVPMTRQEETCSTAFGSIVDSRRLELSEPIDLGDEAASRRWDAVVHDVRDWLGQVGRASRQPARSTIATDVQPVRDGQVLIRYIVLPDKVLASVHAPTEVTYHEVGVAADALGRLCLEFRTAIVDGDDRYDEIGHTLFDLLLRPAWHLISMASHLCIDADGALHHLPFCALMKDGCFVVEQVAISFRTGSPSIGRPPVDRGCWRWLGAGVASLPEVAGELDALPGGERKTVLLAEGFTSEALAAALAGGVEVVHLATHFHLDPVNAGRSSLELGDGSRLSLDMLRQADRFDLSRVELLYLSGCSTGSAAQGAEALESLAGVFQLGGVRGVVGTLWPILDSDARKVATAFYAAAEARHDGPQGWAEALRQSQIAMICAAPVVSADDVPPARGIGLGVTPTPGHPRSWAAHVLFGA